jgi:hypothetical protein
MNRRWIKVLIVSLVTSVVSTLGMSILFGGGGTYLPNVEWDRVDKMNYRDATTYLVERTQRLSGWEAFIQGAQHPRYWIDLLQTWLFMFGFALVCCAVLLWWLGRARAPSNPTPHPDARDASGSASESGARAGGRER